MRFTSRIFVASFAGWLSLVAVAAGGEPAAAQRAIDPSASQARFSIQHIFVARVEGTVPILSGTVALAPGSTIPQSVSATLDATRLNTGDPDQSAAVRGPDYFDAHLYPTWTFASTKITPSGPNAFALDGMLTMHGVAHAERLDVVVTGDPAKPHYRAVAHVDRHAFGMRGAALDPVIGAVADVTLDISLK